MVGEHSLIIFLEIVIFIGVVCICRGIPRVEFSRRKFSLEWRRDLRDPIAADNVPVAVKRRQSLDDLCAKKTVSQHKRRPSEEAMKADGECLSFYDCRSRHIFLFARLIPSILMRCRNHEN